ncbi:hypothetical protein [Burkholderia ambifaria]|uniref:hypothetical protein n=1 Tax=Burkholderia ambifaria TaxID=152480 RepID=UPI0021BBBF15|nr:hypothetical protein [Burkholderia ambifaria]
MSSHIDVHFFRILADSYQRLLDKPLGNLHFRPGLVLVQGHTELFLDTVPFNAGATASCALWYGLRELIAPDIDAYEAVAMDLARSPGRLGAIRGKLRASGAVDALRHASIRSSFGKRLPDRAAAI